MPAATGAGESSSRFAGLEMRVEQLCKSFRQRVVLDHIDAQVRSGDIVAIVGASGSGKTVLLDHLVGLLKPDSGRVLVADHDAPPNQDGEPPLLDLAQLSDEEIDRVRLRWAVVFQRNALFSGSVRDNIALWLQEHTNLSPAAIDQRIRRSLAAAMLDVDDVIDKDRESLSGGMAKRVAIARAIAVDPLVLFYDEPTTGLDPVVAGHIHELIWNVHHLRVGSFFSDELRPAGAGESSHRRTSVIVTHDKELLRRIRPRVLMLHEGKVCFDGPYERFGEDCEPARQYLQAMPVLHARPTY